MTRTKHMHQVLAPQYLFVNVQEEKSVWAWLWLNAVYLLLNHVELSWTTTTVLPPPSPPSAGADLEAGRVGWLFGCRRCAAVDELRTGCEQRYATKRCLQLHYLANASSTGPRSGTLRCGATSERPERGPAKITRGEFEGRRLAGFCWRLLLFC